jgi:hypothetical protein
MITLEPCALNAEFQHFIPRFNKNFLTLQIPLKEGIGGETEGDFTDNSNIYLSHASQKSGLNPTNRQTGWFV